MKKSPEEKLKDLVARFGGDVFQDHRRGEALIRDVFGDQHRREAFVLVMAMRERVVVDLLASAKDVPIDVVCARLVARLEKNLGLTKELARLGVAIWAVALGFARPKFQSDDAVAASNLEPTTTYISKEMRDDELPHETATSPLTPKFSANQNEVRKNNKSTKNRNHDIMLITVAIVIVGSIIVSLRFIFTANSHQGLGAVLWCLIALGSFIPGGLVSKFVRLSPWMDCVIIMFSFALLVLLVESRDEVMFLFFGR